MVDGDVAVGEVFGEIRTFGLAVRAGAGNVSGFEHGVERGVRVEVARAEGEGVGEEDGGGVSAHDVGGVVGSGPAGEPAGLRGVVEEGLGHGGGAVRSEEGLELDDVAVDVPVGEIGVLIHFAVGTAHTALGSGLVDLIVEPCVVAVAVAEDVGREEHVVEAGVEDGVLGGRAAVDLDGVEVFGPFALGEGVDCFEVEDGGDFGGEVGTGVVGRDEGETDPHGDFALVAEVEPGSGVVGVLFAGCGVDGVVFPHRGAGEELRELRGEVEGVGGGRTAEASSAGFAFDGVVAGDADDVSVVGAGSVLRIFIDDGGVGAASGVDEETGGRSLGKAEAGDAGAVGDSKLDLDAISKGDSVVAGMGGFVCVVEGLGVEFAVLVRADGEVAGPGKDGEVSIERAARAADVGEGEAVDALFAVIVPGVGAGVGAPLDHAEGEGGSGERVAAARCSDEGVDGVVGGGGRGLCQGGRSGEEGKEQGCRRDAAKADRHGTMLIRTLT